MESEGVSAFETSVAERRLLFTLSTYGAASGHALAKSMRRPFPQLEPFWHDSGTVNAAARYQSPGSYTVILYSGLEAAVRKRVEAAIGVLELQQPDLYVEHVTMLAVDFAVEHELSHILNGHLDWLHAATDQSGLTELAASEDNAQQLGLPLPYARVKRCLEMDADCTALSRQLKFLANLASASVLPEFPEDLGLHRKMFENRGSRALVLDALIGVLALFQAFHEADDQADTPSRQHPLPKVRAAYLLQTVPAINETLGLGFASDEEVGKLAAFAAKVLGEGNAHAIPIDFKSDDLARLDEDWRLIRPHLDTHAFIELADNPTR